MMPIQTTRNFYKTATLLLLLATSAVATGTVLIGGSGSGSSLQVQGISPSLQTSDGIVTIVSSPGTPSSLLSEVPDNEALTLDSQHSPPRLVCRGATLGGTSDPERTSLATCSLVTGAVIVDGVTVGDVEAGLQNSRHARTLTALFRARVKLQEDTSEDGEKTNTKQTLMIGIIDQGADVDAVAKDVEEAVRLLYNAAAAEKKGAASFEETYDIKVVPLSSVSEAEDAVDMAVDAARASDKGSQSLSSALADAHARVKQSGVGAVALDPPHIAKAFISVGNAFNKQSRTARARIAAWKGRVARGLWIDGFGREADALRKRVLGTFDGETLSVAGLPLVAPYRLEIRSQLQSMVDSALEELFTSQISNLEKSTLKRFQGQLLKTVDEPAEVVIDSNAVALRKEFLNFETIADDLQIPALGLTKEKVARQMSTKLNDALIAFPDSPAAKIKRSKQVKKVVNRERKPSQRAVDVGFDLVAVLRPDGFGSLQGFAGYQLGGNSITFGVHNDADDPQVIAQFGGVRPPLLRVQPKIRLDIEM